MKGDKGSSGWADKALLVGMVCYTLLLAFATADDILGWGLLTRLFR